MFDTKSLNMKHKLLFIAAAVAMLLSACSKPEAEPQVIEKLNISPQRLTARLQGVILKLRCCLTQTGL